MPEAGDEQQQKQPTTAELLRTPAEYLDEDADGERYLPVEMATPRTYPMVLMGSDVRIRLLIWFDAHRNRAVSWGEIARAFPDDDWAEVVEQVVFLVAVMAVRQPKWGMFILNERLVGRELRDLFYELRRQTAPAGEYA